MSRKSPEARTIAVERRIADRYGRKSENRHARRVKAFERNAADYDYESSRVSRKAKMGLTMPSKDARYRAGVNVA